MYCKYFVTSVLDVTFDQMIMLNSSTTRSDLYLQVFGHIQETNFY